MSQAQHLAKGFLYAVAFRFLWSCASPTCMRTIERADGGAMPRPRRGGPDAARPTERRKLLNGDPVLGPSREQQRGRAVLDCGTMGPRADRGADRRAVPSGSGQRDREQRGPAATSGRSFSARRAAAEGGATATAGRPRPLPLRAHPVGRRRGAGPLVLPPLPGRLPQPHLQRPRGAALRTGPVADRTLTTAARPSPRAAAPRAGERLAGTLAQSTAHDPEPVEHKHRADVATE